MSSMVHVTELHGQPVRRPRYPAREVLVVDGAFDLAAAERLVTDVRALRGAHVTVDLRRARIEDAALAAFAQEVASLPVAMVGLTRHHERLLRHLQSG